MVLHSSALACHSQAFTSHYTLSPLFPRMSDDAPLSDWAALGCHILAPLAPAQECKSFFASGSERLLGRGAFRSSLSLQSLHGSYPDASYSTVFATYWPGTKTPVAVKRLRNRPADVRAFDVELRVLTSCTHAHLVRLYAAEVILNSSHQIESMRLVLEYIPARTLRHHLRVHGPLSEARALEAGVQIGSALAHLHAHGYVHHDVKPANVLYDAQARHCTLIDLGLAVQPERDGSTRDTGGSPLYMAPEVLQRVRYHAYAAEVWSFGVVLLEMLTGSNPWCDVHDENALLSIIETRRLALPSHCTPVTHELLLQTIRYQWNTRITMATAVLQAQMARMHVKDEPEEEPGAGASRTRMPGEPGGKTQRARALSV